MPSMLEYPWNRTNLGIEKLVWEKLIAKFIVRKQKWMYWERKCLKKKDYPFIGKIDKFIRGIQN